MEYFELDLQYFTEGPSAAGPAGGDSGSPAAENDDLPIAGETLADGTKVDERLAAALKDQARKHPELKERYAKARGNGQPQQAQQNPQQGQQNQPGEKTLEQRWDELKKGEFKDLIGKDIQKAVTDRFKNHKDVSELEPMLKVLREKAGVETNEDLMKTVLDDDSLYEEEAEAAGMTVEGYKLFKQLETENQQMKAREQQDIEQRLTNEHVANLVKQAEALKAMVPDFDLRTEMQNPEFFNMVRREVNVPVEAAYFAIHHKELMPQAMAYGIQRAERQISQSIQAGQRRPAEGAMQGNTAATHPMSIDPRKLTRKQRDELVRQARLGKWVTFD